MKRKQKLLNEITKLVKIKLLQEVSTPPDIDDILDKLNRLGGDKSKLSEEDIYILDYYSKHGDVPEHILDLYMLDYYVEHGTVPEMEDEYYEEEGMPSTFFEDEKDEWVDKFISFLGRLINMDDIPDDVDFAPLENLGLVEDAPERIMEYIEKNARHLSSRIKIRLKSGDRGDVEEMIDQWIQGEINIVDFAENIALILLSGSSEEPFGM